jgi:hypothetical protein
MSNARTRARRRFARYEPELAQRIREKAEFKKRLKGLLAQVPGLKSADDCIRMNESFLNLFEEIAVSKIPLGPFEKLFKECQHQGKGAEEEFEEVKTIIAQTIDEAMSRTRRQGPNPKKEMGK